MSEKLKQASFNLNQKKQDYEKIKLLNQNIVESLENGLITLNRYHHITYVNPAFKRMTGLSVSSVIKKSIFTIFPNYTPEHITQSGLKFEFEFSTPIQSRKVLSASPFRLYNLTNEHYGTILEIEDVTEYKKLQETIRMKDRFSAIGKLAAGIAHEIRNPLTSMSGSVQLLKQELGDANEHSKLMDIILREIDRLNALITDFLIYAKPIPLLLKKIDLIEIIQETIQLFQNNELNGKKVTFHFALKSEMPINGDYNQIKQLLLNLFKNSTEADSSDITIHVFQNNKKINLTIEDNGDGIPIDATSKIFDPFFTTKDFGTGLGLAIVYRIVELHHGDIDIKTIAPGKTVATLTFPEITNG